MSRRRALLACATGLVAVITLVLALGPAARAEPRNAEMTAGPTTSVAHLHPGPDPSGPAPTSPGDDTPGASPSSTPTGGFQYPEALLLPLALLAGLAGLVRLLTADATPKKRSNP